MPDNVETVEIPKSQLGVLQQAYGLMNQLFTSPKHGVEFKRLLKAHDPEGKTIKVPDIDLADQVAAPLKSELDTLKESNKKLLDRLDARDKADKDERDLRDIHKRIDEVAAARKLTPEGKQGMIKIMQERQIADPEAAALLFLDTLPKTPQPKAADANRYTPSKFNLFDSATDKGKGDENVEKFWKDPVGAMDEEIVKILNEEAA